MNFYEILKTKKLGRGSPDYWTQLFAEHVGGTGEWAVSELTGTLPMTFRSNGTALIDYRIYGTAEGAGVQTENMFDYSQGCNWASGSNGASNQKITAQQGDVFTVTSTSSLYALVRGYDVNNAIISGSSWSTGGTSTYIAPANIAYVKVIFRNFEYSAVSAEQKATINEAMLVKGSTAPTTYIPYGYKIPILLGGVNFWNKGVAYGESFRFYMNFLNGFYMAGQSENDRVLFIPIEGGKEYEITLNDIYQKVYTVNSIDKPESAGVITYRIDGVSTFINHGTVKKVVRKTDAKAKWLAVHIYTQDWENFDATVKEVQNYNLYIGNTKLAAEDYVDYESGKIYKAKRIHEDTVTIDGIEWDILDYDHDEVYKADGTRAKHTVTIQTHDIINELQYSARQAAFAFPNGLAAGTYHFTVGAHPWVAGDVNKMLTFTLANDIAAGGQLVFNGAYNTTIVDTTATIFASPTSTTAVETVTMSEGNTGTDLGTILRSKTDTVNSIDRAFLGNNNWLESAMRQYLNSDKPAGNVWTPQTVFDRPPVWETTTAGFLNEKSTNFISHIGTAKKTTGLNSISDGGRTAVNDEKIFLLSHSEVFMGDEYAGGEDTPYAYYKNYSDNQSPSTSADKNRIKYRAGVAKNWWLRSPNASGASYVRFVYASGAWGSYGATNTYGVAPACCIILDDMDDWVKQTFYTEVEADLPAIETFSGENTLDSTETVGEVTIKGQIKPQS